MFPSAYFLPAEHAAMLDMAATLLLFSIAPLILARGKLNEPAGITLVTAVPLPQSEVETLHLVPFENL